VALLKDAYASLDDRFRIEEQKSVVTTGTDVRDPTRTSQAADRRSPQARLFWCRCEVVHTQS
jgi:hypothetical protein